LGVMEISSEFGGELAAFGGARGKKGGGEAFRIIHA